MAQSPTFFESKIAVTANLISHRGEKRSRNATQQPSQAEAAANRLTVRSH
jgi:hypothetical protein